MNETSCRCPECGTEFAGVRASANRYCLAEHLVRVHHKTRNETDKVLRRLGYKTSVYLEDIEESWNKLVAEGTFI